MKKQITLFCFLLLTTIVTAQPVRFSLGVVVDDEAYNNIPRLPQPNFESIFGTTTAVSFKQYCPEVRYQGEIPSGVGWAVGYAAMTMLHAQQQGITDTKAINEGAFSPHFLYNSNKVHQDCLFGMKMHTAFDQLKTQGICQLSDFSLALENCTTLPDAAILAKAAPYKIRDYFTLFPVGEKSARKNDLVRSQLMQGKPVIIGWDAQISFQMLSKTNWIWQPQPIDSIEGTHALVVLGFDDETETFEVMNSWSQKWGNNGFAKIRYRDFGRFCHYAYVIQLDTRPKDEPITISGKIELRQPFFDDNNELQFITLSLIKTDNFLTTKKQWNAAEAFQITLQNLPNDVYCYAFSTNANKSITVHFPRQEALNPTAFKDELQTAYLTADLQQLTLPAENIGFVKEDEVTNCIIILIAPNEITNFKQKLNFFQKENTAISNRLQTTFENKLDFPNFDEGNVSFKSEIKKENILAILTKI